MARKKNNAASDFIDIVATMPWWVGCVLALVSYVVLHRIATQQLVATATPGQIGAMVTQSLWQALAFAGQFVVPLLCVIGAAASAFRRYQRKNLISTVATRTTADALDGMSWQEFEMLVGEAFRLQGYLVAETGGGGSDGGVDQVLRKGGEKFLVQCKQWKALKVGVTVVRELYGVMAAKGAAGGFVITSGQFTDDARSFASGRNVTLIDGPVLFKMIKQARGEVRGQPKKPATAAAAPSDSTARPLCPVCAKTMVRRTAKQGRNAGSSFWGCVDFPTCRGTRQAQ